jgi:hypothetical protein
LAGLINGAANRNLTAKLHQIQIAGAASTTELDQPTKLFIRFDAHRKRIDGGSFASPRMNKAPVGLDLPRISGTKI